MSPPASEDQQSALQLPQVVSVPRREGAAIATLQVTKITHQLNPYKHMWWIDRGGRAERVKSTINQKTNWNWLSYGPQYYTALLLLYYIVISAVHITFPEENKKEWTRQLNTAEPKIFSHIKVWSLCLVRRGKKQKQFFLVKQCRIHFILSAFIKEQANDLSCCAALHKCSHQKMKDRLEISAAEPWLYIVIKTYKDFRHYTKNLILI